MGQGKQNQLIDNFGITKEQIERYRSRTWGAGNLDDPRCESRGAYKLHGSAFVKPHCVLPAAHQGDHLGQDGAAWRTPRLMTPTQLQIMLVLKPGPLSYYELLSAVDATTGTVDRAVKGLLDDKKIKEVNLGEVVGLRLVAFRLAGAVTPLPEGVDVLRES